MSVPPTGTLKVNQLTISSYTCVHMYKEPLHVFPQSAGAPDSSHKLSKDSKEFIRTFNPLFYIQLRFGEDKGPELFPNLTTFSW